MQASQHQLGKSWSWDCSDCVLMNSEWNVFAEQAINIHQLQASSARNNSRPLAIF